MVTNYDWNLGKNVRKNYYGNLSKNLGKNYYANVGTNLGKNYYGILVRISFTAVPSEYFFYYYNHEFDTSRPHKYGYAFLRLDMTSSVDSPEFFVRNSKVVNQVAAFLL